MKTPTQYFSVTQNSSISPCFFGACNPSHGQDLCCCFLQDLQALVPLTSAAWRLEKLSQTPNVTLPETNSSHLKMDGWKTILSFWDGLFSGAMVVSGRVILFIPGSVGWVFFSQQVWPTKNLANLEPLIQQGFVVNLYTQKKTPAHLWLLKLLHRSRCDHQASVSTSDEQHGGPKVPVPVLVHTSHPVAPCPPEHISQVGCIDKKVSLFFWNIRVVLQPCTTAPCISSDNRPQRRLQSECLQHTAARFRMGFPFRLGRKLHHQQKT